MSDVVPVTPSATGEDHERRLVDLARQGDSQAFGKIYQRHVDRVYSFLLFRVRDAALAEDLTQDVFVQALRGLGSYTWQGAIAPWLLRIARNAVIDHWRRVGRRPEMAWSMVEAEADGEDEGRLARLVAEEDHSAVSMVETTLERDRIAQAAACLTELQQQVLACRFASGLSIRQTAEAMGRSEGAIKNLQHHALKTLRRVLDASEVIG